MVATSCCIRDVLFSMGEGKFRPPTAPTFFWNSKLRNTFVTRTRMQNLVKIGSPGASGWTSTFWPYILGYMVCHGSSKPVIERVAPYAAKKTARCDCWQQLTSRDTSDTNSDVNAPVSTSEQTILSLDSLPLFHPLISVILHKLQAVVRSITNPVPVRLFAPLRVCRIFVDPLCFGVVGAYCC